MHENIRSLAQPMPMPIPMPVGTTMPRMKTSNAYFEPRDDGWTGWLTDTVLCLSMLSKYGRLDLRGKPGLGKGRVSTEVIAGKKGP